ncbi:hypothetical protein HKX48_002348 [Thoreauomyces humboldtii]|nr:hypothetical protein HKX48_002348 [Thoreauomyces humboldtii]
MEEYVKTDLGLSRCQFHVKPLDVPQEFLDRFGLTLTEVEHPQKIDELACDILASARTLAAKTLSHVDFAKLITLTSNGDFKYDGHEFWQFTNSWNLSPVQAVRQFFDSKVVPIWAEEMKDCSDALLLLEQKQIKCKLDSEDKSVYEFRKSQYSGLQAVYKAVKNNNFIKNVVECFRTDVYDKDFVEKMDIDPFYLGCNNEFVDIRTGELHPFSKEVFISKSCGYNYFDENNPRDESIAAEWEKFIKQVLPVEEIREIVQEYFGYCLRGNHPEKIFVVLKDKSGGFCAKSKFVQAILSALGSYGTTGNNEHIYESKGFSNQSSHNAADFAYELLRLVIFEELTNKRALDNKQFKFNHGGNAEKLGRRPNSRKEELIKLYQKEVLIFNDECQPILDTGDGAGIARILVFPFVAKFHMTDKAYNESTYEYKQRGDPNIGDKFPRWRPYILEWLLEGYKKYEERHFTIIPEVCTKWRDNVVNDVHNLKDFIDDHIIHTKDETDLLTLTDIKDWMGSTLKKSFSNNSHMIKMLKKILTEELECQFVVDTEINGNRKKILTLRTFGKVAFSNKSPLDFQIRGKGVQIVCRPLPPPPLSQP